MPSSVIQLSDYDLKFVEKLAEALTGSHVFPVLPEGMMAVTPEEIIKVTKPFRLRKTKRVVLVGVLGFAAYKFYQNFEVSLSNDESGAAVYKIARRS